jgi:hypothetical protein
MLEASDCTQQEFGCNFVTTELGGALSNFHEHQLASTYLFTLPIVFEPKRFKR